MSNDDMNDRLTTSQEAVPVRTTALQMLRYRAEDLRRMADALTTKANLLDSLSAKLIEIEREARSADGSEWGPHIGNGSDAEQALWMLATEFRIDSIMNPMQTRHP